MHERLTGLVFGIRQHRKWFDKTVLVVLLRAETEP